MKLRVARHTHQYREIIHFYTTLLGLKILGSFKNHSGYDGVFLGLENESWHLEFTFNHHTPTHQPDEDDLLVFYYSNIHERQKTKQQLEQAGYQELSPKNPYWLLNGNYFNDPDGFGVMLALE